MHSRDPEKSNEEFQNEFEAVLKRATREGVFADFTRFVFPGANYRGRAMEVMCSFNEAIFTRYADFGRVKFAKDANFVGVTFSQEADFGLAMFAQNADFSSATFTGSANFTSAMFAESSDFSEATFTNGADFSWATFRKDADFSGVGFVLANFSVATFTQNTYFSNSTFARDASFRGATFRQDAYLYRAAFAQGADFIGATFAQDANFVGSTFAQDTEFSEAAFLRDANFNEATFASVANFEDARFLGAAEFRKTGFRRDERLAPGPVFSLAEFSRPEVVVFYKTYLGQAVFLNCDVSKFTFSFVEWRKRQGGGKRMVFEEVVDLEAAPDLRSSEDSLDERNYGLVAELYQQLKKNYDERKDYWTAGDFHYGEMEMKRLSSPQRKKIPRWLHRNLGLAALYKCVSEYGESYVRPFIWLLVVLAIFTLLFPLAGLSSGGKAPRSLVTIATGGETLQSVVTVATQPAPPAAAELSYWHFSDFAGAYSGMWKGRAAFFGHSLMTTLYVAGFQKDLAFEPSYPWGRLLALAEVLLTSTLFALFLLAIRRQFRR
jgi:hypothetical protein